jgi:hypothetical protein
MCLHSSGDLVEYNLLPHSTFLVPSLGALVTGWMSWLKRLRGKRPKFKGVSADEVSASSQALAAPTVPIGLKGKEPARQTIAVESQQVCVLTTSHERCFQFSFRTLTLPRLRFLRILTLRIVCSVSVPSNFLYSTDLRPITDAGRDLRLKVMNVNQQCVCMPSNMCEAYLSGRSVINSANTPKVIYRPMPSSSNNFVGREDDLTKLEAVFGEGCSQPGCRPIGVLSGIGGMGKTQLSVKFAETRSHL